MRPVTIGATDAGECERCRGVWLDVPSFESICANLKERAALLGAASRAPLQGAHDLKVRYSPCPACEQLMNRINFDRSGVVVDICKGHGIWFDRDELSVLPISSTTVTLGSRGTSTKRNWNMSGYVHNGQ
jgi:Zn-finger nucleic acid-binding protein